MCKTYNAVQLNRATQFECKGYTPLPFRILRIMKAPIGEVSSLLKYNNNITTTTTTTTNNNNRMTGTDFLIS